MKRKFSEQEALEVLDRNGIETERKTVIVEFAGLKVWAAIDCLTNHFGYTKRKPE